ncbi:MAG TPA: hypothetical protein VGP17_14565 [Solirubrobacteraceae bacterium]|nr:hypothetical protein [Solirubrobacteraceae bacterium]
MGGELDGPLAVVALNGGLDELGRDAAVHGAVAAAGAADAEVVGVALAALAATEAVGQAMTADAAEDRAAQVVLASLRPLLSGALLIEEHLHAVESVLVDQRLMDALERLLVGRAPLVDDPAGVVGVAEDALPTGRVDLLRRALLARPRTQAEPVQLAAEGRDGVFAGGVELKAGGDEVLAVRIGHGDGDAAAVR